MEETGFTPTGQLASLASLQFAENGSVVGCQFVQTTSGLVHVDLQGTYTFDNSRTGTLTLNSSSTDEEGNAVNTVYTYKLVAGSSGDISALRTNLGYYSVAKICPGPAAAWNGTYMLSEIGADHNSARLAFLNLDAARNVSGTQFVQNLGIQESSDLSGSYEMLPDGFGKLALSSKATNADGDEVTVIKSYVFIVNRDGIRMMQSDSAVMCVLSMGQ